MESKFKVGDRVRQVKDYMWRGIEGVYDGRRPDGGERSEGLEWDYFIPDAGSIYSNGDPCTFAGKPCWMGINSFELIETPESKAISLLRKIVDHGGYGAIGVEAKAILGEIEPVDPLAAKAEQYYSEWLKDPSDMPFAQDAMLYAMRRMRDEGE